MVTNMLCHDFLGIVIFAIIIEVADQKVRRLELELEFVL